MTKKQFRALCRQLVVHLPGYRVVDDMLLAEPITGHVVRGFCFQGSAFNRNNFDLNIFRMPLFQPTEVVYLFDRLMGENGCGVYFDISEVGVENVLLTCIQQHGFPFLATIETLQGLREHLVTSCGKTSGQPHIERTAYCLVMTGDYRRAVKYLDRLFPMLDRTIPWDKEMYDRNKQFKKLLQSSPEKAKAQLFQWEEETVANLGLGKVPRVGASIRLDPLWLTPPVKELAETIDMQGACDRLPILADALEEAGCSDPYILNHCRSGGEHAHGCWVVNLLLGKE